MVKSRAAVAFAPRQPLQIVELDVESPKAGEVMIKMTHSSLCHTDMYTLFGSDAEAVFPVVLGHEGGGVIVEVGEGVTKYKVGDVVVPCYIPECGECKFCKSGKTNLCSAIRDTQGKGLMPDGTTRFSYEGKPVYHYMGCSTLSEYSVVSEISIAKMPEGSEAHLDKLCLLGCGVPTGMGAVYNVAKVQPGDNVVIFGMGCVGLAATMAASKAGAGMVIGVDTNPDKEEVAKKFGVTHFINASLFSGKGEDAVKEKIIEMTDGGVEHSFECIGNVKTMRQALECTHKGWGQAVIIGVAPAGEEISTRPFQLVTGRQWKGCAFGGLKGPSDIPPLARGAMNIINGTGDGIDLDQFITQRVPFEEVNQLIADISFGIVIRGVLHY